MTAFSAQQQVRVVSTSRRTVQWPALDAHLAMIRAIIAAVVFRAFGLRFAGVFFKVLVWVHETAVRLWSDRCLGLRIVGMARLESWA